MKLKKPNLISRISIVLTVLVIIPLMILGAFLYQNDKKLYEKNARFALSEEAIVAEKKFNLLIKNQLESIDDLAEAIKYGGAVDTHVLSESLKKFHTDETSALFVFEKIEDSWENVASTHKGFPRDAFKNNEIARATTSNEKMSTWIGKATSAWLFIGKEVKANFVVVSAMPVSKVQLELSVKKPFPVNVLLSSRSKEPIPTSSSNISIERDIPNYPYKLSLFISKASFNKVLRSSWIYRIGWYSIAAITASLILSFLIGKRLSKPLKELIATLERVAKGDLSARAPDWVRGFELSYIGGVLNNTLDELQNRIESERKERKEKERLFGELTLARDIQLSLFPKQVPPVASLLIEPYFEPAKEVSGDYYDLYLSNSRLLICIADGADKGVKACLFSLSVRSALRALIDQGLSLKDSLEKVSAQLSLDAKDSGMFVTAWVGLLDIGTYNLEYINCGHMPALYKQPDGSMKELSTNDPALGIEAPLHPESISLEKGASLLLYTDGLTEQMNDSNEEFGVNRLKEVLKTNCDPKMIISDIKSKFNDFQGESIRQDDITLLTFTRPNV